MTLKEVVDKLLDKAASASDPLQALQYSQAALNAAHTKHALGEQPPKSK